MEKGSPIFGRITFAGNATSVLRFIGVNGVSHRKTRDGCLRGNAEQGAAPALFLRYLVAGVFTRSPFAMVFGRGATKHSPTTTHNRCLFRPIENCL
jgi:hypothetical protein